ncbi:hypothetical protein [Paraburkholderia dinghuensis]|uniref:hypothetical protein n=1 Tax=Paraburkholderia dinghuensis TaxID=2305225 RepID=UPI0016240629|nr:hypothetical protein [Paraburkholderia dinghuensis]
MIQTAGRHDGVANVMAAKAKINRATNRHKVVVVLLKCMHSYADHKDIDLIQSD